jgi:hypothetical protein
MTVWIKPTFPENLFYKSLGFTKCVTANERFPGVVKIDAGLVLREIKPVSFWGTCSAVDLHHPLGRVQVASKKDIPEKLSVKTAIKAMTRSDVTVLVLDAMQVADRISANYEKKKGFRDPMYQ